MASASKMAGVWKQLFDADFHFKRAWKHTMLPGALILVQWHFEINYFIYKQQNDNVLS